MANLSLLSVLLVLPVVAFYFLCSGHYQWTELAHVEGTIDYVRRYTAGGKYDLKEVTFPVLDSPDDSVIHGWLLTPRDHQESYAFPLVLMAHGLGSQKDMGLLPYAERFADKGFAAILIDYRYFGGSTNSRKVNYRNLINPWNHVADIQTVLTAVRKGKFGTLINHNNMVLWGTSLAGGHMLKIANDNPNSGIKAVISQVPHLDGKAASLRALKSRGPVGFLRAMLLALVDIAVEQVNTAAAKLGFDQVNLPAVYVKIVGTAAETAYMILDESEQKMYFQKHPVNYLGGWRNLAPARTLAFMSLYNPIQEVPGIKVPILFVAATDDNLCPIEYVRNAAELAQEGELLEVNTTHFDLYQGENFAKITERMVEFAFDALY